MLRAVNKKYIIGFFALMTCAIMCLIVCIRVGAEPINPLSDRITRVFFGMHIHRATTTTAWPKVEFGSLRLWDASVAWPNLEPEKGKWNFAVLDKHLELAKKNNIEILLPLGLSPVWASARPNEISVYKRPGLAAEPRNIEDWRNFVRTVAARYKGRIKYYEIWNEPNLKGYFSGTVEQMVLLSREAYQILKEIDPSIVVVSPSATGGSNGPSWLNEYLSKGGGNFADVIGYHFYVTPDSPEAMVPLINKIRKIMMKHKVNEKPLWNTEAGWDRKKVFSPDEMAASYVARAYIVNWAAGVSRFYWYAWDNKNWVSLRMTKDDDSTTTSAATAFAEVQKWLIGSQMVKCSSDSNGTWTCQLANNSKNTVWIIWNTDKTMQFDLPGTWAISQGRDLKGLRRNLKGVTKIQISPSPLLLESEAN